MRTRKRFLMALFIVIVFIWAIGMGGLVIWQTTHHSSKVEETSASDNYQPSVDSTSQQSKFGELLGK